MFVKLVTVGVLVACLAGPAAADQHFQGRGNSQNSRPRVVNVQQQVNHPVPAHRQNWDQRARHWWGQNNHHHWWGRHGSAHRPHGQGFHRF